MCKKQVVLKLPDNIDISKENRSISADECCVGVLQHLWSRNLDTRGHCCGHGKCNPSIILSDAYTCNLAKVLCEIKQIDDRRWDIFQWQLTKIN